MMADDDEGAIIAHRHHQRHNDTVAGNHHQRANTNSTIISIVVALMHINQQKTRMDINCLSTCRTTTKSHNKEHGNHSNTIDALRHACKDIPRVGTHQGRADDIHKERIGTRPGPHLYTHIKYATKSE